MTTTLDAADSRPTRVRFLVVALAMVTSVMLYLDRFCISFAERYIKEDFGLTNTQMSYVLGAFFLTYALFQVPTGWLSDRLGARITLTMYILVWSLFTGLTSMAVGIWSLLAVRLIFGIAQAGAYPTCAGVVKRWMPATSRGFASSLVAVGGRMGGALATSMTAFLIVLFVPNTVSSLLAPTDLLDAEKLGAMITDPQPPKSAVDIDIRPFSEILRAKLGADGLQGAWTTDDPASAATALNRLLADPELFTPDLLRSLPLPNQASQLKAKSDRTAAETERLNRLVLETVYPAGIRKIYGQGWRPVLIGYAGVGIAVGIVFWLVFRQRPAQHPWCNAAEAELIAGATPAADTAGRAERIQLGPMVTDFSLWMNSLAQFGTNVGWVFLLTWLPRYLAEVHHVPIEQRGKLTMIPVVVGFFGMVLGGWITDRLTRRIGLRWGRALPMAMSRFVASGAYVLVILLGLPAEGATILFAVVAFSTDLGGPALWAYSQDVGGKHTGSVLGWANMWGNLGATVSPYVLNEFAERGSWNAAFTICALAFFVAGCAGCFVNAEKKIAFDETSNEPPVAATS